MFSGSSQSNIKGSLKFNTNNNHNQNKINLHHTTKLPDNKARNLNINHHNEECLNKSDRNYSIENIKEIAPNLQNEYNIKFEEEEDSENEIKSDRRSSKKIYNIGPYNLSLFQSKFEDNKENYTNFGKTKEIEFLYSQYLYNSFFQCVFSLTSIVCSILQYEWEYSSYDHLNQQNDNPTSESVIYIANCFCFISSIFLWIVIVFEHYIDCRILFLRKNLPERIWRNRREQILSLIFKIVINLFHPCPFFIGIKLEIYNEKYNFIVKHSLNSIMTVLCLIRLWCIFKFYLTYSFYFSARSQRICQMNNFDTSLHFSIKANMTKAPQNAYLILFLIILGYCSYCLRIFERELDEVSGIKFSSFWNCIWCLIINMTTVGYGDYFPSTLLGRFIGILACIFGIVLISMLIVTVSNLLDLTPIEEYVFKIIRRIKLTKEKDEMAAKILTKYIKVLRNMNIGNHKVTKVIGDDLLLGIHDLNEKLKDIDDTFPNYGENDIMKDRLSRLDESVDEIKLMYNELQNQVNQIKEMLNS